MMVEPDGDGLEELAALVESGGLRVLVDETFPLDQAADAHRSARRAGPPARSCSPCDPAQRAARPAPDELGMAR